MRISAEVFWGMVRHGVETFPDECCGVLVGTAAGDVEVIRVRNVQDEMHAQDPERFPRTARTAYAGEPGELLAAVNRSEEPGNRLAAFYHSHPDHDSYFSDEDIAQATPFGEPNYPEALQIVVSIYGGEFRDVKAFGWDSGKETYVEVPLEGVEEALAAGPPEETSESGGGAQ